LIDTRRLLSKIVYGDSLPDLEWVQVMKQAQVGLMFQEGTRSSFRIFYENIDTDYDGRSKELFIDILSSIGLES